MADQDSDFSAFLSGFVVGGLVGAAVALLMAPQSGEETRTVIRDKSIELRDVAMERADEVRAMAGEAVDTAKGKAADLQKRGQVVLEEQKERLSSAIEAGKKAVAKGKTEAGEESEEAAEA